MSLSWEAGNSFKQSRNLPCHGEHVKVSDQLKALDANLCQGHFVGQYARAKAATSKRELR